MNLARRAAARRVTAWALAATVMLAGACGFDGVGEGSPAPADGGGTTDGGPATDDADVPIVPDAAPRPGCGSPTLQAGAPWPMLGGCISHAGRSVCRGPHGTPHEIWEATVKSYHPVPSIGADDTIYVPADTDGILAFPPTAAPASSMSEAAT